MWFAMAYVSCDAIPLAVNYLYAFKTDIKVSGLFSTRPALGPACVEQPLR